MLQCVFFESILLFYLTVKVEKVHDCWMRLFFALYHSRLFSFYFTLHLYIIPCDAPSNTWLCIWQPVQWKLSYYLWKWSNLTKAKNKCNQWLWNYAALTVLIKSHNTITFFYIYSVDITRLGWISLYQYGRIYLFW